MAYRSEEEDVSLPLGHLIRRLSLATLDTIPPLGKAWVMPAETMGHFIRGTTAGDEPPPYGYATANPRTPPLSSRFSRAQCANL